MIIQSTIRSETPAPRRAKKLEELQVVRAPAVMLPAGIPKKLAIREGLPTPAVADTDPIALLASDLKRSLDPVTLSILEGLPRTVMAGIDPRLGHAYDGALLLVGDVQLVQRWLDRDEDDDEHIALVLDTAGAVLDHAEFAAQFVPSLSGYVPWIKTAGVIVKLGKTTHKALVEFDETQDAQVIAALQKASTVRFVGRPISEVQGQTDIAANSP